MTSIFSFFVVCGWGRGRLAFLRDFPVVVEVPTIAILPAYDQYIIRYRRKDHPDLHPWIDSQKDAMVSLLFPTE